MGNKMLNDGYLIPGIDDTLSHHIYATERDISLLDSLEGKLTKGQGVVDIHIEGFRVEGDDMFVYARSYGETQMYHTLTIGRSDRKITFQHDFKDPDKIYESPWIRLFTPLIELTPSQMKNRMLKRQYESELHRLRNKNLRDRRNANELD